MSDSPVRTRVLLIGAGLVICAVVAVFLLSGRGHQDAGPQPPTEASTSSPAQNGDTAGALSTESAVAPDFSEVEVPGVDWTALRPRSTEEDLAAKRFPQMSNPRRAAYTQTAEQSIPEVAADLGNLSTRWYCTQSHDIVAFKGSLNFWRVAIPPNIKVLRLIEEGRNDPDTVTRLLRDSLTECLSSYDDCRKAYYDALSNSSLFARERKLRSVGENDPYYNRYRKYEGSVHELERVFTMVYMAFYTLANIDRLGPPGLLAEWLRKERGREDRCIDLDVWLIDVAFRQTAPRESEHLARHNALTQGADLSGARIRQSRWNASWDIHNWMLGAKGVDLSDIQTIEVLAIPTEIPFDDDVKQKIIRNFLDYAGTTDGNVRDP